MGAENVKKIAFYLAAVGFHWALFFTNGGNYFHGGTPFEWIALQAVAVLIVVAAVMLVPKARIAEKILVIACAVVPLITVAWALLGAIQR